MFCKFFIVACKSFKKITGGGVNMLNAGGPFQEFIEETDNAASDEKGADITDNDQKYNDQYEAYSIIPYMNHTLGIGIGKDGYPTVNTRYNKVDSIGGNGYRSQYQQALQEILQYFFVVETLFHGGSF
jgi:hypothetical protein